MSRAKAKTTQPKEPVEVTADQAVDTEVVEETTPEVEVAEEVETEAEPESVPVEEPAVEEAVVEVEPEVVEDTPVVVESKNDDHIAEQIKLAKELNLTIRTDATTGEPILPSTPVMRMAAARQALKPTTNTATFDIENHVMVEYGDVASNNPDIKFVVATLTDYVKRMSPSASIDEVTGGAMQAKLAGMYDVVLSLKPEVSQMALEVVVATVKQNIRGAFEATAAYRFANTMPLDSERAIRFQLLTTLFSTLASGTKKKDLAKAINVRQLLEYVTDRNAKANISEFIN